MKHYEVMCYYCVDGKSGIQIVGATSTYEEALTLYNKKKLSVIKAAKLNGYNVTETCENHFSVYADGDYAMNHINLNIEIMRDLEY